MTPRLSVLIVVYDMVREAPRTIASALPPFQKEVQAEDYEVLVLENGSSRPLGSDYRAGLPENARVLDVPEAGPSPGAALNWGAEQAAGDALLLCIDGARILSERLIADSLRMLSSFPSAFVYTFGWHLGPDLQQRSARAGYDQDAEDELLARADWYANPSRLFELGVLASSSQHGLVRPPAESNAFAARRQLFEEVGGFDERFRIPGGSTSNLEIFRRYVTRANALNICLLNAGTFHQVHGGAATADPTATEAMFAEYEEIFGEPLRRASFEPMFYGSPHPAALEALAANARSSRAPRRER